MKNYKVCVFYDDEEIVESPSVNFEQAKELFFLLCDLTSNLYTKGKLYNTEIVLAHPDKVKTITIKEV